MLKSLKKRIVQYIENEFLITDTKQQYVVDVEFILNSENIHLCPYPVEIRKYVFQYYQVFSKFEKYLANEFSVDVIKDLYCYFSSLSLDKKFAIRKKNEEGFVSVDCIMSSLENLIQRINKLTAKKNVDIIYIASILHCNLIKIRPVEAHNEIFIRLITNFFLFKHGYDFFIVTPAQVTEYRFLIYDFLKNKNYEHFAEFIQNNICKYLSDEYDALDFSDIDDIIDNKD